MRRLLELALIVAVSVAVAGAVVHFYPDLVTHYVRAGVSVLLATGTAAWLLARRMSHLQRTVGPSEPRRVILTFICVAMLVPLSFLVTKGHEPFDDWLMKVLCLSAMGMVCFRLGRLLWSRPLASKYVRRPFAVAGYVALLALCPLLLSFYNMQAPVDHTAPWNTSVDSIHRLQHAVRIYRALYDGRFPTSIDGLEKGVWEFYDEDTDLLVQERAHWRKAYFNPSPDTTLKRDVVLTLPVKGGTGVIYTDDTSAFVPYE